MFTAWLFEANCGGRTEWWAGDKWTTDARQAVHFVSREGAECTLRFLRVFGSLHAGDADVAVVEHAFDSKPGSRVAWPYE